MNQYQLSDRLTEAAREELRQLEARDQELVAKIDGLEQERSELRKLIGALRTLATDTQDSLTRDLSNFKPSVFAETDDPIEIAINILREKRSEDVHYKRLSDEVIKRGGSLPKSDPWTHLNYLMNQDARFTRPRRRGYYALKEDYPNLKRSVGERRRKRTTKPQINGVN